MINKDNWIVDLAQADSSREILHYEKHSDVSSILRDDSFELLSKLNSLFFEYAESFNSHIKPEVTPLKVLGITNKQNFMVFRNNFRLNVSIYEPGIIFFNFENFTGGIYSPTDSLKSQFQPDEVYNSGNILVARVGPFNGVKWLFNDQEIIPERVVRHYFTEFVKASTDIMKNIPKPQTNPQISRKS